MFKITYVIAKYYSRTRTVKINIQYMHYHKRKQENFIRPRVKHLTFQCDIKHFAYMLKYKDINECIISELQNIEIN